MIYLTTGTPGAGKTLLTIDYLSKIKDRQIYYHDIVLTDLGVQTLTNWQPIDREKIIKWQELPKKSIIVVDEAHKVFPIRGREKAVPKWIEALAEHRHEGFDFYLITQHPMDLDLFIRRRVYQHTHYKRQYGYESCTAHTAQQYIDVNSYHDIKNASTKRVKYPRNVYALYHSAVEHTVKKQVPFQFYFFIAMIVFLIFLGYKFVSVMFGAVDDGAAGGVGAAGRQADKQSTPASPQSAGAGVASAKALNNASAALRGVPPFIIDAKKIYISSFVVFGKYVDLEYLIQNQDDTFIKINSEFFRKQGAIIVPVSDCVHKIRYADDLIFWATCPPVAAPENILNVSGQGKSD